MEGRVLVLGIAPITPVHRTFLANQQNEAPARLMSDGIKTDLGVQQQLSDL